MNNMHVIKIYNFKYLERYIKFINHYKDISDNVSKHFEIHHILPKSLFIEHINNKDNLVKLPHRAHYIAHYMLAKIYKNKMTYAFNSMNNQNFKTKKITKINSILYEANKINFSEQHSIWHKQKSNIQGLTNSEMIGLKTKESKLLVHDYYTEISNKSATTMVTTIQANGLTIAENRAIKTANTIKESGVLKGSNSSNAKIIQIFNNENILKYQFFGDFFKRCKELDLPARALKSSYNNNSKPIYQSKCGITSAKNRGFEKYIGWYAVSLGRTRDHENYIFHSESVESTE